MLYAQTLPETSSATYVKPVWPQTVAPEPANAINTARQNQFGHASVSFIKSPVDVLTPPRARSLIEFRRVRQPQRASTNRTEKHARMSQRRLRGCGPSTQTNPSPGKAAGVPSVRQRQLRRRSALPRGGKRLGKARGSQEG